MHCSSIGLPRVSADCRMHRVAGLDLEASASVLSVRFVPRERARGRSLALRNCTCTTLQAGW